MNKESSIITIVGAYYPLETGFSLAFQNLQKAILREKKVDKIYVLAPFDSENPQLQNLEYIKLKKGKGFKIVKTLSFLGINRKLSEKVLDIFFSDTAEKVSRIIQKSNVKMILIESMFLAWAVPLLKKRFHVPVVVRIHGSGPEVTKYQKDRLTRYNRVLLEWVFDAKYIAATTSYYFDFFQEYWNDYNHFINKYFFVIPNTVEYAYVPQKKKDNLVFLQLGRMDKQGYHQKGFTDTIEALYYLEQVLPEKDLARIHYISIGNGEKETEFVKLISGLKYIKKTHYSNLPNTEVKKILDNTDVVIIPSRCEGMSMFATEALAIGKAFIYTTGNGLKDIIIDGYNGIGIKAYDYISIAKAMECFLKSDELIETYSKNSRKLYEREFAYKPVADKFSAVLSFLENCE